VIHTERHLLLLHSKKKRKNFDFFSLLKYTFLDVNDRRKKSLMNKNVFFLFNSSVHVNQNRIIKKRQHGNRKKKNHVRFQNKIVKSAHYHLVIAQNWMIITQMKRISSVDRRPKLLTRDILVSQANHLMYSTIKNFSNLLVYFRWSNNIVLAFH